MTLGDDGRDAISDALQEQFGGLVVEYVVIANVIAESGQSVIAVDSHEDQRNHTTLGLLAWGLAVEQARAVAAWNENDDAD